VRVYHGHQTELPRHYVARQKLCLRATTDYWVNAMDGQAFFVLNQAVDPGMLQVLEHQIVPRLEQEIPNQPTPEQLQADAKRHRFTLIFDREGYSPGFMQALNEKRIACLTYHKYPGENWPSEEIPDTTKVVSPEYRRLDGQVRSLRGHLTRKLAAFSAMNLKGEIEPQKVAAFEQKKSELQEQIEGLSQELDELKTQRKAVKHHISIAELPEEQRFKRLSTQSKHLIDTVKMVAYRAETAMAQMAREKMRREDDARSLLRALYSTEADLLPDENAGTLKVRVHHQANRCADEVIRHFCDELNQTETIFPGTQLRLIYELVSD
jgi:predicted  nucleic acid-binding Zn-ribbon protein